MLSLFWQREDFGRGGGKTRLLQTCEGVLDTGQVVPGGGSIHGAHGVTRPAMRLAVKLFGLFFYLIICLRVLAAPAGHWAFAVGHSVTSAALGLKPPFFVLA